MATHINHNIKYSISNLSFIEDYKRYCEILTHFYTTIFRFEKNKTNLLLNNIISVIDALKYDNINTFVRIMSSDETPMTSDNITITHINSLTKSLMVDDKLYCNILDVNIQQVTYSTINFENLQGQIINLNCENNSFSFNNIIFYDETIYKYHLIYNFDKNFSKEYINTIKSILILIYNSLNIGINILHYAIYTYEPIIDNHTIIVLIEKIIQFVKKCCDCLNFTLNIPIQLENGHIKTYNTPPPPSF